MYFESGKQDICIYYGREIFSTGKVTKTSMWDDDIKMNFRQLNSEDVECDVCCVLL